MNKYKTPSVSIKRQEFINCCANLGITLKNQQPDSICTPNQWDFNQKELRRFFDEEHMSYEKFGNVFCTLPEYCVVLNFKSDTVTRQYLPKLLSKDVAANSEKTMQVFKRILINKRCPAKDFYNLTGNFPPGSQFYTINTFPFEDQLIVQERVVAYLYSSHGLYFVLEEDYINYVENEDMDFEPFKPNYDLEIGCVYELGYSNEFVIIRGKTPKQYRCQLLSDEYRKGFKESVYSLKTFRNEENVKKWTPSRAQSLVTLDINGDWRCKGKVVSPKSVGYDVAAHREKMIEQILN